MNMKRGIALTCVVLLAVGVAANTLPGLPYPTVWGTVINVLDRSRIVIQIVGSTETVRYVGSYASPVEETTCGAVAAQVNYQMTFGRLIYLEFDQELRDAEGTLLAYVYLDGAGFSMVNAMLVATGITKATAEAPSTRYADVFAGLAAAALGLGLGCLAP